MTKLRKAKIGCRENATIPLTAQKKAEKITDCLAANANEPLEISVIKLHHLFDGIMTNQIDYCADQNI